MDLDEAVLEGIEDRLTAIEREPALPDAGLDALCREALRPIAETELELVHRERPLGKLKTSGRRTPLAMPAVSRNIVLNRLAFALLQRYPNLKGTVYGFLARAEDYDPAADFDVDLEPFANLISGGGPERCARAVLAGLDPTDDTAFARLLDEARREIFALNLLGHKTRSKFGWLASEHARAADPPALRNLARTYLYHLAKYRRSLPPEALVKEDARHARGRFLLPRLLLGYRINELSGTAFGRLTLDRTLALYRDEIAALLNLEPPACDRTGPYHLQFTPRNADWFTLGSRYGDCTALRRLKQHFDVENIFWTKAAWIFDPFYQILELRKEGIGLIKAHLHIAFLRGHLVLNVDAIETAPQIRLPGGQEIRAEKRPNLDEECYAERFRLLEFLLDRVRALAAAMGIGCVVCELFSNTGWVRDDLERYPSIYYPVRDYHALYDNSFVRDLAAALLPRLGRAAVDLAVEIQATNTRLFDIGLKPGTKICAVLQGRPDGVPFREAMRSP